MRRSALPLASVLQGALLLFGVLAIVVGPSFAIYFLVENHYLRRSLSEPLQVVAVLVSVTGAVIWAMVFTQRRARARRMEMDKVKEWVLAQGFREAQPTSLPPGEQPAFRSSVKVKGYVAEHLTIHTIPFTLEGNVRVQEAYTRTVGETEVALVYVAIEAPPDKQGNRALRQLRYTVVIAGGLHDLPEAWIEPQGKADGALLALGARDVDVESAAFNDEWRVYTTDVRAAHGFLSPRVISHLIEASAGRHSVALESEHIVTAVHGWTPKVETVEHLVRLVTGLVEALPQGYRTGGNHSLAADAVADVATSVPDAPVDADAAPPKPPFGPQYTKAYERLKGFFQLVGLVSVAYPFFTIPGPGEEFHPFKFVLLFGGGVLIFAGPKLARFILGDQRALRRPGGRVPRNPS